jgi:hypothetical protein
MLQMYFVFRFSSCAPCPRPDCSATPYFQHFRLVVQLHHLGLDLSYLRVSDAMNFQELLLNETCNCDDLLREHRGVTGSLEDRVAIDARGTRKLIHVVDRDETG